MMWNQKNHYSIFFAFLLSLALLGWTTGCKREKGKKENQKKEDQVSKGKTSSKEKSKSGPPKVSEEVSEKEKTREEPPLPSQKGEEQKSDEKKGKKKSPSDRKYLPRIKFDKKFYEFGTVVQGEKVEKIFAFQNTGQAPLRIVKVQSSCLCAPTLLAKKVIPPGERGKIKVTFKTQGLAAKYYDLSIKVYHNDPREKDAGQFVTRLNLSGKVRMLYKITPPGAEYLGSFESQNPPSKTFLIVALHRKKFAIEKIHYDESKIEIKVSDEPLSRGKVAKKLKVKVKGGQPPGEFICPIRIETNDRRQEKIYFKVWGQALGEVTAEPEFLLFGPVKRNDPDRTSRTITVFQRQGRGLEILKVTTDTNLFDVKVEAIVKKKKYEISLKLKEDAPQGPFSAKVKIFTNHRQQPLLTSVVLGALQSQVRLYPSAFYFRAKAHQKGVRREIHIGLPNSSTKIEIGKKNLPSGLEVSLKKETKEGYRLVLEKKGATKAGKFKGFIELKTSLRGEKNLLIPLRGEWKP